MGLVINGMLQYTILYYNMVSSTCIYIHVINTVLYIYIDIEDPESQLQRLFSWALCRPRSFSARCLARVRCRGRS